MRRQVFDRVRGKWVTATPEEAIRQSLVEMMIGQLNYPPHLIALERELSTLTSQKQVPKRRVDIVVYSKSTLLPLLIIECKSIPLTPSFADQVIGYNAFIRAPYIALANNQETLTGTYNPSTGIYEFASGLPNYNSLLSH